MRCVSVLCLTLCSWVVSAPATTYIVTPDGTGDFPTIQAALDAVSGGDVIELADGTFAGPGNRDLDYHGKAITVQSSSGAPDLCIIDCGGSQTQPHRGFHFHSSETGTSRLDGVTVTNGYAVGTGPDAWGGAILCYYSSPTITHCVLEDNIAGQDGGGIMASYGSPALSGCTIRRNLAGWGGGVLLWGGNAQLTDCRIEDNEALSNGGGVYCTTGCTAGFTRVTFCGNTTNGKGGAIVCNTCSPTFSQCTSTDNEAGAGSGVWTLGNAQPVFDHTIIAFGAHAAAFRCESGGSATLACCDVYGNEEGDFTDCVAEQLDVNGNISADPLFCDRAGRDYTLQWGSPCGPLLNPDCGLVGAWPAACGFLVNPDGSGSHPTIQAAVDGAVDGATIILGEGVFSGPGNRDIDLQGKSLRIVGGGGDATHSVVDCQGSETDPHRGFIFDEGETPDTEIRGITVTHAYAPGPTRRGGGVRIVGASPTLRNCIFLDNRAEAGGAVSCDGNAFPVIEGCTFAQNRADRGGAIASDLSGPQLLRCTFVANAATAPDVAGACIESASHSPVFVTNAILCFSPQGQAVRCVGGGGVTLTCSDIFGNAGGDWTDGIADQAGRRGNFSADPLFCNLPEGDYELWNNSPCSQEGCGLIGAWPVGCTAPQGIDAALPPTGAGPVLLRGFPNPFSSGATIHTRAPEEWLGRSLVLDVYEIGGRRIRTLATPVKVPGAVDLFWDGLTSDGREAPGGVYLLRLRNDAERRALRVVIIRR